MGQIVRQLFVCPVRQLVFILALGVLGFASTVAAKPLSVEIKSSLAEDADVVGQISLYQESYALVIGIDDYSNGWPRLSNAVKDAREVAAVLESNGFNVDLKEDLKGGELKEALRNFFILRGGNPEARLLLWFAGHGQTIKGEGFLVAADTPAREDPSFKLSAVHMRDFGGWVRLAESKHVLAVFDSCFAGTIFNSQRGTPPASITRATTYPVRQFITSGEADQLVLDNGTFRELFVRALSGEEHADVNADGYLTASELGYFLSDRVTNLTQANQTPRYGKLRDKDYDRGDFVLAVLAAQKELVDSTVKVQSMETENLLWDSVRKINTESAYQHYLEKYPMGTFSGLAHSQIEKLSAADRPAPAMQAKPESNVRGYTLNQTERAVYAARPAMIYNKPDRATGGVTTLPKGEKLAVIAEVEGLSESWLQIFWSEKPYFIPTLAVTSQKPRKSMAELIAEKRQERKDYLLTSSVERVGASQYKRQQCLKKCKSMALLGMDSASSQRVEEGCSMLDDSYEYAQCKRQAESQWRQNKRNQCEKDC